MLLLGEKTTPLPTLKRPGLGAGASRPQGPGHLAGHYELSSPRPASTYHSGLAPACRERAPIQRASAPLFLPLFAPLLAGLREVVRMLGEQKGSHKMFGIVLV